MLFLFCVVFCRVCSRVEGEWAARVAVLPHTVLVSRLNLVLESTRDRAVDNLESNPERPRSWPEPRSNGVWDAVQPSFDKRKGYRMNSRGRPRMVDDNRNKVCRRRRRINVKRAILPLPVHLILFVADGFDGKGLCCAPFSHPLVTNEQIQCEADDLRDDRRRMEYLRVQPGGV